MKNPNINELILKHGKNEGILEYAGLVEDYANWAEARLVELDFIIKHQVKKCSMCHHEYAQTKACYCHE